MRDHSRSSMTIGIGDGQQPEAARIGAQGGGHHFGVAAVVLGAGQGEAVAEAIHLLGVDGVNHEAALEQRFDHGAVRDLDRDMDLPTPRPRRLSPSARPPSRRALRRRA